MCRLGARIEGTQITIIEISIEPKGDHEVLSTHNNENISKNNQASFCLLHSTATGESGNDITKSVVRYNKGIFSPHHRFCPNTP